jgi:hypothetical protein
MSVGSTWLWGHNRAHRPRSSHIYLMKRQHMRECRSEGFIQSEGCLEQGCAIYLGVPGVGSVLYDCEAQYASSQQPNQNPGTSQCCTCLLLALPRLRGNDRCMACVCVVTQ